MSRPSDFEFAMDFLGDPESSSVRAYVETLESEIDRLRSELAAATASDAESLRMYRSARDRAEALAAELAAAVEREREECAKVCDVTPPYPFRPSIEAAHAIRARSQEKP